MNISVNNDAVSSTQTTTAPEFETNPSDQVVAEFSTANGNVSFKKSADGRIYVNVTGNVNAAEVTSILYNNQDMLTNSIPELKTFFFQKNQTDIYNTIILASGMGPINPSTPLKTSIPLMLTSAPVAQAKPYSWENKSTSQPAPEKITPAKTSQYETTYTPVTHDEELYHIMGDYRETFKAQKQSQKDLQTRTPYYNVAMPFQGETLHQFYERVAAPQGVSYEDFLELNRRLLGTNFPDELFVSGTEHTDLENDSRKDGVFAHPDAAKSLIPYSQRLDVWYVPTKTKPEGTNNARYEQAKKERDAAYAEVTKHGAITLPADQVEAERAKAVRARMDETYKSMGIVGEIVKFFEHPEIASSLGENPSPWTLITMAAAGKTTYGGGARPVIVRTLPHAVTLANGRIIPAGTQIRLTDAGVSSNSGNYLVEAEIVVPGATSGMQHNPRMTFEQGSPTINIVPPVAGTCAQNLPTQNQGALRAAPAQPAFAPQPPVPLVSGAQNPQISPSGARLTPERKQQMIAEGRAHEVRKIEAMEGLIAEYKAEAKSARERGDVIAAQKTEEVIAKLENQIENSEFGIIHDANAEASLLGRFFKPKSQAEKLVELKGENPSRIFYIEQLGEGQFKMHVDPYYSRDDVAKKLGIPKENIVRVGGSDYHVLYINHFPTQFEKDVATLCANKSKVYGYSTNHDGSISIKVHPSYSRELIKSELDLEADAQLPRSTEHRNDGYDVITISKKDITVRREYTPIEELGEDDHIQADANQVASPDNRNHSNYPYPANNYSKSTSGYWINYNKKDFNVDDYYRNNPEGFKFHISIHPSDMIKASHLLTPIFEKYGVPSFKFAPIGELENYADPNYIQRGKTMTIYYDGVSDWSKMAQEIETTLKSNNIKPGQAVINENKISGSQYTSVRGDHWPVYKGAGSPWTYISNQEIVELANSNIPGVQKCFFKGYPDPNDVNYNIAVPAKTSDRGDITFISLSPQQYRDWVNSMSPAQRNRFLNGVDANNPLKDIRVN